MLLGAPISSSNRDKFNLGDEVGSGHPNEQPLVPVVITDPFFFGVRPVTQAHWSSVMNNNPSKFSEGWSAGLRPVESISYNDVELFLKRLNSESQEYMGFKGHWRLPSESEWEYVAKLVPQRVGRLATKIRNSMLMDGMLETVGLQLEK